MVKQNIKSKSECQSILLSELIDLKNKSEKQLIIFIALILIHLSNPYHRFPKNSGTEHILKFFRGLPENRREWTNKTLEKKSSYR